MKVAVFGLKANERQKEFFDSFFSELEHRNIEIIIEKDFLFVLRPIVSFNLNGIRCFSTYEDLSNDTDLLFTFGGDGTILEAATVIRDKMIPVVGVNTGRLGFLATINVELLFESLDDILSGNYNLSRRSLISVESNDEIIEDNFALNEMTVTRRETTSMITVTAKMNGEFLNSFWADGLIVSTPTGSTGYSLSCGGPIVHPENNTFIITPIAPHNLNVRPFIISDDSILDLTIESRVGEYFLSLDSRNKPLSTQTELRIRKAGFSILIVEPRDKSYLMTLREKLLWGSDKRN